MQPKVTLVLGLLIEFDCYTPGVLRYMVALLLAVPVWPADSKLWIPAQQTSWQWQLTGAIDISVDAEMYDVDLFTTTTATLDALHARGRRAICYVDAGSYEPGRPDSARFPDAVKGKAMSGWPDERWLDIRRLDVLGPIMEARLDLCKAKGFDGVEPDNVDGYQNKTGFPLTDSDQLAYNRFLAKAAHDRGLSVGLKNDISQLADLVGNFDWALNEECFTYNECGAYRTFSSAGKAVFHVEYELKPAQFCTQANALNFNSLQKKLDLNAYRVPCREAAPSNPSLRGVTNAASYSTGGVSPGEIIVLFGTAMGGSLSKAVSIDLPVELAGTKVFFDDTAAQLLYVSDTQVSAVVPASVRGKQTTQIKVDRGGSVSAVTELQVRDAMPGIFTADASGAGQAAAANQDETINTANNPAAKGSIVLLYATGLGNGAPRVSIGGKDAEVQYAGGVVWGVPGLVQINAKVPDGISGGPNVAVILESAGVTSQNGVVIAVRQ